LTPEKLGNAKLVEEVTLSDDSKIVKVTGVKEDCKTITMLIRGSSKLV
jgi:T-complex protein 1 subunit delta